MDYKAEMNKMKRHRELFGPVLNRMYELYKRTSQEKLPIDLTNDTDIHIVLELLDIGYLDREAFPVKKKFGTIEKVLFNGSEPLTDAGLAMLEGREFQTVKRRALAAAIAFAVMLVLVAVITC